MDLVLAGRYELEVLLGRGASGEVWRGGDMATRRLIAARLVELAAVDDGGTVAVSVARFLREATVLGRLRDPSVVAATDAGRIGSQLFVITELVPGASLAGLMDERGARGMGLFPLATVLDLARQACAGLAAAHEAGVVHRDIRPGNLMVTPRAEVKIIDFGVAQLLADNAGRLVALPQSVSSIAFMPPEAAQGFAVDERSDLYSVGCLLYQLLSGRLPFFSSLPSALRMMQVLERPTPLAALRPDLPAEVCRLVGELMEKDPSARPATAAQVVSRIEAIEWAVIGAAPDQEAARRAIEADLRDVTGGAGPGAPLTPDGISGPLPADAGPYPEADRTPADDSAAYHPAVPMPPGPPAWTAAQGAASRSAPGPVFPGQRPRRAWRAVIMVLVAAVLAAGSAGYLWQRQHQRMAITKVTVTTVSQSVGCHGTADLIGTMTTNGRGGVIRYEWVAAGDVLSESAASSAGGSDTVQVRLEWPFHFRGKGRAVVQLRVLSPQQEHASIIFPYSCPA